MFIANYKCGTKWSPLSRRNRYMWYTTPQNISAWCASHVFSFDHLKLQYQENFINTPYFENILVTRSQKYWDHRIMFSVFWLFNLTNKAVIYNVSAFESSSFLNGEVVKNCQNQPYFSIGGMSERRYFDREIPWFPLLYKENPIKPLAQ